MSRHGVTHTNVFPRLGIGADFTRLGLHGTVVMNNVLTDWGEGRRSEPWLWPSPLFSFLGSEEGSLTGTDTQPLLPGCGREVRMGKPHLTLLTMQMLPPVCVYHVPVLGLELSWKISGSLRQAWSIYPVQAGQSYTNLVSIK